VLKDFEPPPELARSLLTSYEIALPLDPAMEEYLWRVCDYGWLTNSARRPSSSTDLPRSEVFNSASIPSPGGNIEESNLSPDFESLLQGALSFDFGLLSQIKSRQDANGIYIG
jgi:hypothetical protein